MNDCKEKRFSHYTCMYVCLTCCIIHTHTHLTYTLFLLLHCLLHKMAVLFFYFLGCWAGIHSNICIKFLLYCRHCGRVMKIQRWIKMWILLSSSLQPPEEGGTINNRVEGSANRNTLCIGLVKKFVQIFPDDLMEKHECTFQPTQYSMLWNLRGRREVLGIE